MKKFFEILSVSICSIYLFVSCNGCGDRNIDGKKNERTKFVPDTLLFIWSEANNNRDTFVLRGLYDTVVHFYQKKYSVDECIRSKIKYFDKHPDFKQRIEGQIFVDTLNNGLVRLNFTKSTTVNNKEEKVSAYLIFRKYNGIWKIRAESDLKTDRLLSSEAQIPSNSIKGDFNGDGITDDMWLESVDKTETCKIRFSGDIPSIIINTCLGGIPVNEGDINGDGADEVGILPVWETSCWKGYFVYTFRDNQWMEALEPIPTHCIQWEKDILPVVRDSTRKGYVFVYYSELTDNGIEIKTKTINLR
jgi:hypothetical protein